MVSEAKVQLVLSAHLLACLRPASPGSVRDQRGMAMGEMARDFQAVWEEWPVLGDRGQWDRVDWVRLAGLSTGEKTERRIADGALGGRERVGGGL